MNNEDGYQLWLRYRNTENPALLKQYRDLIKNAAIFEEGAAHEAIRYEINLALPVILDRETSVTAECSSGSLVMGTLNNLRENGIDIPPTDSDAVGEEGFRIVTLTTGNPRQTVITAETGSGVIRGMFHFLRLLQTNQDIGQLDIVSNPKIRRRILAHWDNIDISSERGYAGGSIWKWAELPEKIDSRYRDYARACASLGINGTIPNNPNARPESLSAEYLEKTAVLADIFRPYGIRMYLSANFAAPILLGGLATADPRNPEVARWWKDKVDEIYRFIPDFGGFQVKAFSESQPGPQDYGAGHLEGANMLAEALHPHGGVMLWRAFVYSTEIDSDRAKCAYKEFVPLDGKFQPGVFIQVKNGPVDFQPREPFSPLFGGMPKTPVAMEFQVTQEYYGQDVHLVCLAPMWKEVLDADTFAQGKGSPVSRVIDGSLFGYPDTAIVGVANTGADRNWCGHHFAQANWYAYGRLAWDYTLPAETICEEWARMTWSNDPKTVTSITNMMLGSWEACVNYMTPLGLHHLMKEGHHYGPNPGYDSGPREDWNNVYYHKADKAGLGFNRSSTGSGATGQYFSPLREEYDSLETCPEKYLLWFHHVPWSHRLKSGGLLMDELRHRYQSGVDYVTGMRKAWESLKGKIDDERHEHVSKKLEEQEENAKLWRDICTQYFGTFAESAD